MATIASTVLSAGAEVSSREINDGWRFRQWRSENWYPATVPGTVHTDLMANEIIEDPFFRLNERSVQWVDKEDWMYETHLVATPEEVAAQNQELVFNGLDTYATVYLNHERILQANNMHRTWRVNVKGILKEGDNLLEVFFDSPIKVDLPKYDQFDYTFNTGPDQAQNGGLFNKTLSIFARKAGYHYGWDWGPRLVTSGIWRPIELQTWSGERINNVQFIQKDVTAKRANLSTVVEVLADEAAPAAEITITADGKKVASKTVSLEKGLNKVTLDYTIKNPRLWWSNGLGEPYLTKFATTLNVDGKKVETEDTRLGIRSLKLIHKTDDQGHCLYFELNGKPVFAKGACMVPMDNFLPRITTEKYLKHVTDAKDVNMNMIRIWGGGVYEDDRLYDFCDENGIMIWQDFMFACSTYPADSAFLANIRQEAIDNVRRLRNHCSIAVWCGNNECQDVYYGWGGRQKYYKEKGVEELTTKQFEDMYFRVLPEVVEEYAGGVAYRPSSPFAFRTTASDGINGDDHYWGVWHGRDSIGHYNVKKARFFSEYGFQSFPEFESVKIYAPKESDWRYNSDAMMDHQRAGSYANGLIRDYMRDEYRVPEDFPTFLYVGGILQGDAIKTAFEAHRRDMPHCMGSLVWQHNDCWPVASWAARDYYGRWKAQQYFSKYALDDVLVSPLCTGDTLTISVINDRRNAVKGKMTLRVMDLKGNVVATKEVKHNAQPLSSKVVYTEDVKNLIGDAFKGDYIFVTDYETPDRTYHNIGYAIRQKYMNYERPNIDIKVTAAGDGYDVAMTSDVFARGVFLSLDGIDNFFSDNYIDILPGATRTIHVTTPLGEKDFRNQLKLTSMGHAYANVKAEESGTSIGKGGEYRPLGGD
ncbi:MAG: beta-mannosidase [Bacteroidales bacterium 52_46]|nr:MAG: beta-mannosidase [Bacteroidales bacterium 52_46]